MKSLLIFFAILVLAFSQIKLDFSDETHGCQIPEGEEECCWINSNGCCQPGIGQICTMAIKTCCKKKVYDEETGEYKYVYN